MDLASNDLSFLRYHEFSLYSRKVPFVILERKFLYDAYLDKRLGFDELFKCP